MTAGDVGQAGCCLRGGSGGPAVKKPSALPGGGLGQGGNRSQTRAVRGEDHGDQNVSSGDLEEYESEVELQLYREYKDVCPMFTYVVETERRFYLANRVEREVRTEGARTWIELTLEDAWVWDMYRQNRFVTSVKVVTFKDVNIEELPKEEVP